MTEAEWLHENPPPIHRFITRQKWAEYGFTIPDTPAGSSSIVNDAAAVKARVREHRYRLKNHEAILARRRRIRMDEKLMRAHDAVDLLNRPHGPDPKGTRDDRP